jgi:L-asparaginase
MHSKLIIHGGFFSESHTNSQIKLAKQKALSDIVNKSYNYLNSHSALETSVYAVSLLEDCELFNAGIGSQIQSDGKIILSGKSQVSSGSNAFGLARLNTDGSQDTNFGTGGVLTTIFGTNSGDYSDCLGIG